MNRNKKLAKILCTSMVIGNITPAFATVTNETNTYDDTTQNILKETEVLYEKAGNYFVTIPKTISLGTDKQSSYSVKVEGDVPSDKQVYVSPIDGITELDGFNFYMHDTNTANPKADVVATVIQNKFYWSFSEVANGYSETDNQVTAEDLTSGHWKGTFDFEINMHKVNGNESHTHNYIETIIKEPTCTKDGEKKLTCSCGDTKTETIPSIGHHIVDGNCTNCDVIVKTIDDLVIGENLSFDMGTVLAVKKTDTLKVNNIAIPEQTFTFDKEGDYQVTVETINPDTNTPIIININITIIMNQDSEHTHNYTETIIKDATCIKDGEKKLTCSCGDIKTETIPSTGHNYEDGICKNCGETDPNYNVIDPYPLAPENAYMNWNYTLNESNKTITLNYYSGSETDVIVYSTYPINGTIYKTKLASNNSTKVTKYMFSQQSKIQSIKFGKNIDTSETTSMRDMFYACYALTDLDLSNLNTKNVTDMDSMFHSCSCLKNLDLSNFDTSNVTDMSYMFNGCSSLTNLNISNFDTGNVTDMRDMFDYCISLTSLDVSSFDTSNTIKMSGMFSFMYSLTDLDVSNFDTSNVIDMKSMFNCCKSLTSLDISNFNTSNTTDMRNMFANNPSLNTIYVTQNKWKINQANTEEMFKDCGTSTVTYK